MREGDQQLERDLRRLLRQRREAQPKDDGIVDQVVGSPVFKDFMRTAAREIARGMFKTGRR